MKRYLYSLLFAALLLSWSCEKPLEVAGPAFSVYPVSEVVKAGEEFRFRVEGQVDYLIFYSGEEGHEYKFRERTSIDQIKPLLQFSSYKQWGTKENTLKLLVSTNFSGKIDSSLADAQWVDITSRAALSQGEDNTPSGSIDLSDFVSDKPVYLAFKYEDAYDEIKPQITWTIKDISLKNVAGTREFTVFKNAGDAGFVAFDFANAQRKWTQTANQLQIAGGGAKTADNTDWIVSRPLFLNQVDPDRGLTLMDMSSRPKEFSYTFARPGTYEAVFVGKNASIEGEKQIEKRILITVVPAQ